MKKCVKCNNEFKSDKLFETDEFGKLKESVKYCVPCFTKSIKSGEGNFKAVNCSICNSKLEPILDDVDDIRDEGIVFFKCPKDVNHEEYGEYLIQPSN
jgi:hypothetical protein